MLRELLLLVPVIMKIVLPNNASFSLFSQCSDNFVNASMLLVMLPQLNVIGQNFLRKLRGREIWI